MKKILITILVSLLTISSIFAISGEEAKSIALSNAGVLESEVTSLRVKNDLEDGVRVYDIEFRAGNKAYEYEVAVSDGTIISVEHEIRGEWKAGVVEKQEAIEIALADAGLSSSDVKSLKARSTSDDGHSLWKVTFKDGSYKYEYEIDKAYGGLFSKEYEALGKIPSNKSGAVMSIEKAREIFFSLFPVESSSEIRIEKDYDDGLHIYEGSAYSAGFEYDAEIDAVNGKVLSFSLSLE